MLARDFAAVLGELEPHLPLSDLLEKEDQESPRWYFSQRTHLVGYISRKAYNEGWDTLEVAQVWSGITRPEARFWIIEALGMVGSEGPKVVNTLLNDLPLGTYKNKYKAHRDYLEERYPLEAIIDAATTIFNQLEISDKHRYKG